MLNYATHEACWVMVTLIKLYVGEREPITCTGESCALSLDLLMSRPYFIQLPFTLHVFHLRVECRQGASLQLQLSAHPLLPSVLSPSSHSPDPFSLDACLFCLQSL